MWILYFNLYFSINGTHHVALLLKRKDKPILMFLKRGGGEESFILCNILYGIIITLIFNIDFYWTSHYWKHDKTNNISTFTPSRQNASSALFQTFSLSLLSFFFLQFSTTLLLCQVVRFLQKNQLEYALTNSVMQAFIPNTLSQSWSKYLTHIADLYCRTAVLNQYGLNPGDTFAMTSVSFLWFCSCSPQLTHGDQTSSQSVIVFESMLLTVQTRE